MLQEQGPLQTAILSDKTRVQGLGKFKVAKGLVTNRTFHILFTCFAT